MGMRQDKQFSETPLFNYLEEKQSEETAIRCAKEKSSNIKKLYLANFTFVVAIICSVCVMFYTQFRVDNLQKKVDFVQGEINESKAELRLLKVEWCYLTRPERLRYLSTKYLKKNDSIEFSQIKDYDKLQKFYLANLKRKGLLALNDI